MFNAKNKQAYSVTVGCVEGSSKYDRLSFIYYKYKRTEQMLSPLSCIDRIQ